MTYIERLNAFWESYRNAEERYTEAEVALYMMLLDIFNRNKWPEGGVKISTTYLCDTLCWSRKKLTVTRDSLKTRRMIQHENSQGSSSPFYLLPENLCFVEETQSNLCCAQETQNETQTDLCFAGETQKETQIKEISPTPPKEILEDNNTLTPRACEGGPERPAWAPTWEEVQSEAKKIMMLEEDAEAFYNHYERQEWLLGNGLPLKVWRLKLAEWNNQEKTRRYNEQTKGPKVNERPGRKYGNESVETQTPETAEILARNSIMNMIAKHPNPEYMKQVATRAYKLRGTFSDAHALLNSAFKENIPEARAMLGVG